MTGFKTKSMIKTFRDLEIYQRTTNLSFEVLDFKPIPNKLLTIKNELDKKTIQIPQIIAQSYCDKFENIKTAIKKLELANKTTAETITLLDVIKHQYTEEKKDEIEKIITNYQKQKRKILNLKKSWTKFYKKDETNKNT